MPGGRPGSGQLTGHGKGQASEQPVKRIMQGLGPRRRHHAMGIPDQKFVIEDVAQAGELRGERRLADTKPPCRRRDPTLVKQGIKRDKQAEIAAP